MADPAAAAAAALAGLNNAQIQAVGQLMQFIQNPAGGARGAARLPTPKSIPCSNYVIGQDYNVWSLHFKDNVRAVYSITAEDDRLGGLCLQWISTKLDPGPARAVYDNLPEDSKATWELLNAALAKAFTDDKERLDFLGRMNAHQRTPGMSLRTYKDQLLQKMDNYQSGLRAIPAEFERVAVQRFREGLNNKLLSANIMMNCIGDKATIEHAFTLATNWENTMSHLGATPEDPSGTAVIAGLLGVPSVSAATPVVAGLAMNNMSRQPDEARWDAVNTKLKEHELKIATLTDGQEHIKTSITEGFKEMRQEMAALRRDVTQPRQQPYYNSQLQRPAYQARPQQNFQYQQQYRIRPGNPATVPGITPNSRYVNNNIPSSATYTRPSNQHPEPHIGAASAQPEGTQNQAQPVPAFSNPMVDNHTMAAFNLGHGWQPMVDEIGRDGYNHFPQGEYCYTGGFRQPADHNGGDPLA